MSSSVIQHVTPPGNVADVDWNSAFGGAGNVWFSTQPGSLIMGRTNYLASAGDPRPRGDRANPGGTVDAHGLFYFQAKESVGRVPDGTSNTLMFVECAGGLFTAGAPFVDNTWTMNAWAWGVWWAPYGVCPNTRGAGPNCENVPQGRGLSVFAAGSLHAGNICNVALADGSVRGLNVQNLDSLSLVYLAGSRDGEVQGLDF
jgi:prepilin-type processing-associated H-X9-DG protein